MSELIDLIKNIEKAEQIATSNHSDSDKAAYFLNFITENAPALLTSLFELIDLQESGEIKSGSGGGNLFEKQNRVIVEGFSDISAADALSDALNKAVHYFSEMQDVSITLKQLNEIHGGGHRAVLELHITPINLKDRAHIKSLDVEQKKFKAAEFKQQIKQEEGERRHLVFDHFVPKIGAKAALIPDHFLISLGDANLMNYMIEKEFFHAGHAPSPHQKEFLVRSSQSEAPEPE